jgi:hypothetical protein
MPDGPLDGICQWCHGLNKPRFINIDIDLMVHQPVTHLSSSGAVAMWS